MNGRAPPAVEHEVHDSRRGRSSSSWRRRFYTLYPGDLLFTGTPEGVSPIAPGDRIVATVERIGAMEVECAGRRVRPLSDGAQRHRPAGRIRRWKRAELRDLYARMGQKNIAPLWEVLSRLVPPEPHPACVPALWSFDRDIRPLAVEAGGLITAKQAERRVAVLENPGLRGLSQITQSLYAGVQLLTPGRDGRQPLPHGVGDQVRARR